MRKPHISRPQNTGLLLQCTGSPSPSRLLRSLPDITRAIYYHWRAPRRNKILIDVSYKEGDVEGEG